METGPGRNQTSPPEPHRLPRRRLHRAVFITAGIYNIGWGIFSALDPQWLFRFAGMPLANHPQIFACLGMVVGLYGILYLEVARVPERGWLLAAVGLTGKILGPIGLIGLLWQGVWPPATLILCVTNDFIWWIPFALYLSDSWPHFHRSLREM
jgi:hypothetical protein